MTWSLKGKAFVEGCYKCNKEGWEVYYKKQINRLREKLIEDITNMTDLSGCNPSVNDRMIACINKRFGVE